MATEKFELHAEVLIIGTGNTGVIVGVWIDEDENTKYLVRYTDANSVIQEIWVGANGLRPA